MKKVKYVFLFVLCLVLSLGSSVTALAEDYLTYPYYIKNYDVNITVNEDNSCHITENIDCFFNQYRHGIYRYIPVYFAVYRADETSSNVRVKIKHAKCSDKTSNSIQNSDFVMQIGDEDETVIGEKSYTISYDYYVGPDNLTDADEFYFNIIGDGWDTVIDKCNFTITMPKEFDSSKLGFSTGNYGFVGTDIVDYKVDGNVITGHTTAPLREYEALTVRTELDDGYFTFDYAHEKMLGALMIAIPAIVLAFVLIIWLKFGKDKKVIETVEFYPPEGMNSLEVSYWYNGKVEKKEIVAILIELANEGFIEINEDGKDAYIHRLRNYDGDDDDKRQLFDVQKRQAQRHLCQGIAISYGGHSREYCKQVCCQSKSGKGVRFQIAVASCFMLGAFCRFVCVVVLYLYISIHSKFNSLAYRFCTCVD